MPNSIHSPHFSSYVAKHGNVLRPKDLQIVNFQAQDLIPTISGNILQDAGRLRSFNAYIIEGGAGAINAIRTTLYDTSGTPTEEEPELFSFLSYARRESGITSGFSKHNLIFPELGIKFEKGIGFISVAVLGTPVLTDIEANFGYVRESDIAPKIAVL